MIRDTSFFLDLIVGDEGAIERARQLEVNGMVQRFQAPVVPDRYVGVGDTHTPAAEIRTRGGARCQSHRRGERGDRRPGRTDGRLWREGVWIAVSDITIGATGLAYDETVVTRDTRDFERLPGVKLATY